MTPTRQVVLGLTISGILFGAANGLQYVNDEAGRRIANPLPSLGGWEMLIAWGSLFITFVILSEMPPTQQLAVAFVWLITLTMVFTYGIAAFENLRLMIGDSGNDRGGGGGGSRIEVR